MLRECFAQMGDVEIPYICDISKDKLEKGRKMLADKGRAEPQCFTDYDDMLAAARIDGCGKLHIFTAIMLPLGTPALIAQFVLGFIGVYNDYQNSLIYLKYPEQYTMQLALSFFNSEYVDKALASAAAVFGIVPLLIIYVIFQNKIISGISFSSGLKG